MRLLYNQPSWMEQHYRKAERVWDKLQPSDFPSDSFVEITTTDGSFLKLAQAIHIVDEEEILYVYSKHRGFFVFYYRNIALLEAYTVNRLAVNEELLAI